MKKKINLAIALLSFLLAVVLCLRGNLGQEWIWILAALAFGLIHLYLALTKQVERKPGGGYLAPHGTERPPQSALTELVLLSEEDDCLASWNIYGGNGVVIGRDIGENQVTVNLNETTYASMIDVDHAVLNYSGEDWFVEDISERNGVSVQKRDGRKYKLSYGKPCKLERGDIIFIAMTRLQIL